MKTENLTEPKILPIRLDIDLPTDHLCMVMAQPLLKLQQTDNGFKIDRSILATHKRIIESTFKLVRNLLFGNGSYNTNFVLFPELSLPHDMILEIKNRMSHSWPQNSILIGGIEGISVKEYYEILQQSDNPREARYKFSGIANYVNCAAVFVKQNQGDEAKLYLQPKIKPSRREEAIEMQEGRHIFFFTSPKLNFLSLICFDAIYTDSAFTSLISKLMRNLRKMSVTKQIDSILDIVFILMHNEDPYYRGFQESVYQILNGGGRELRSDHGSVVFINTANSGDGSSDRFGKSAFHFRRKAWYSTPKGEYPPPSTYCMEDTDCECQRARFREDGPSLYSFRYIPYTSELHISKAKCYPFQNVAWCQIKPDGMLDSPQSLPAIKKIVSDNLPPNLPTEDNRYKAPNGSSLAIKMRQNYNDMREKLMTTRPERMKEITDLLLLAHYREDNRIENPDYWKTDKEGEAIKELASTLSILALIGEMTFDLPSRIVTGFLQQRFYTAVMDGKRTERPASLQKKYKEYMERNTCVDIDADKNIFLVLCRHTREQPHNGIAEEVLEIGRILTSDELGMPEELRDARRFTSISGGRVFWHSQESLQGILEQTDLDVARTKLEEKLGLLTN